MLSPSTSNVYTLFVIKTVGVWTLATAKYFVRESVSVITLETMLLHSIIRLFDFAAEGA